MVLVSAPPLPMANKPLPSRLPSRSTVPPLTVALPVIVGLPPALLVTVPPVSVPPPSATVPLFDHAGAIVNVLAAALIVPVLTGAAVSVALLLRLKLPVLASVLLIAPRKKNAPALVSGPL